jgi:hypothetical protein
MHLLFWFLASFILALAFTFLEVLVLAAGINNLHYSLYYSVFGIAGFVCRHHVLKAVNILNEPNMLYKIGGYIVLIILIVGCIALIANIIILFFKR